MPYKALLLLAACVSVCVCVGTSFTVITVIRDECSSPDSWLLLLGERYSQPTCLSLQVVGTRVTGVWGLS